MINNSNKRLDYLDNVKGIGILLVVLGHIYNSNNPIKIWLYSFHMPLFFIISGMLLYYTKIENKDIKTIIISKFKSLIIPYISFELIAIFIFMIQNEFTLYTLKWNIIDSILMYCKAGTTWFLFCLFVSQILFILIKKYFKLDKITIFISFILFIIPLILKTNNHTMLVLFRCFIATGFLCIGYYIFKILNNKDLNLIFIIILFLFNIILSSFNGLVDLWSLRFGNIFLYIICSIIGSISMIYLFKNLNFKSKILNYLGKNSLIIMATHQILLSSFINNYTNTGSYNYLQGFLIFILIVIIEIPIIKITNKYLPFMLGKFK